MTSNELQNYAEKGKILEHEIKTLIAGMGLDVPDFRFLKSGETLAEDAGLKFPLVAKVSGEKISSKTDVGGVALGINDFSGLKESVSRLLSIKGAEGVIIEKMAPKGLEVIVGGIYDPQFGPAVMFGLGGLFVEVFRDVAFAITPINEDTAIWLIKQVRGHRLLEGYRGSKPIDKDALVRVITATSWIMETGLVEEMDFNPVSLYPSGAIVLDAKMKFRRT